MTIQAKTCIVCTKTEFNFIATDTLNIYPSPVYHVLNVNWSAFSEGHFANPPKSWLKQWNQWRASIGQWDLGLLPLTLWPTGVSLATVWASWLLMECPKRGFVTSHPTHSTLSYPTTHPTHPLYQQCWHSRKRWQKYHEIQSSAIEKVSYEKPIDN